MKLPEGYTDRDRIFAALRMLADMIYLAALAWLIYQLWYFGQ